MKEELKDGNQLEKQGRNDKKRDSKKRNGREGHRTVEKRLRFRNNRSTKPCGRETPMAARQIQCLYGGWNVALQGIGTKFATRGKGRSEAERLWKKRYLMKSNLKSVRKVPDSRNKAEVGGK